MHSCDSSLCASLTPKTGLSVWSESYSEKAEQKTSTLPIAIALTSEDTLFENSDDHLENCRCLLTNGASVPEPKGAHYQPITFCKFPVDLHKHTHKQTNTQTNKWTNQHTNKHAHAQTNKQTSTQAHNQPNTQTHKLMNDHTN